MTLLFQKECQVITQARRSQSPPAGAACGALGQDAGRHSTARDMRYKSYSNVITRLHSSGMWKSWWFSCNSAGHFVCVIIIDLLLDSISEKAQKKIPGVNVGFKWYFHLALIVLMVFLILLSKIYFLLTSSYHILCFSKMKRSSVEWALKAKTQ